MTQLYYDPIFLEHHTGDHPENAGRLGPVLEQLNSTGLAARCSRPSWSSATLEQIHLVHTPEYVNSLQQFIADGGGRIETDTMVSSQSFMAACKGAGAVCDAVQRVVQGQDKNAFCLLRPPGHHALPDHAMGFCLLNNIAIGARVAQQALQLERVLIVDFDVHHGNGTQDTFWSDGSVGFLSMHRYPFYPGSGAASETGTGIGLGMTVNIPIAMGTAVSEQQRRFRHELERLAGKLRPQLVMLSAGFDSHRTDPIGSLGLETNDFSELTQAVLDVANVHAAGRVISVLEGGYNPAALAECVGLHVEQLLNGSM
jgi:acetoin utilization deacetylase AcuC-like enzyme